MGVAATIFKGPVPGEPLVGLLDSMDIDNMNDTGMWWWAGILAVVALAASLGIAVWWQRRKA